MRRLWATVCGFLASASSAWAVTAPTPGGGDPRIQTVVYDPQQVVSLRVAMGFALTLEFASDERIENVAVGNGGVWQVSPNKNADHLFIKPQQGAVDTDMVVVTDARTYAFDLKASPVPDPAAPILVRLVYPPQEPALDLLSHADHYAYSFSGARALRPAEMRDDGQATYILWALKAPIPAVYVVDAEGRESLVNGGVRQGQYVVDQTAQTFIFRLDGEEARASRHLVKAKRR